VKRGRTMAGLEVITTALQGSAGAARQVGDTLQPVAGQFNATDAVIARHAAFGSAAALQECLTSWSQRLRTDAGKLSSAGDLLGQTAASYEDSDRTSASRLAKVERELPL
jgi:uncharacterized protein YukE